MKEKHLTDNQLIGCANGSLEKEESEECGRHLLSCDECLEKMPTPTKEAFLKAVFGSKDA